MDFRDFPDDINPELLSKMRNSESFRWSMSTDLTTGEKIKPIGYGISFPTRKKEFLAELVFLELRAFTSSNPHHQRRAEETRQVYRVEEPWLTEDDGEDLGGSGVVLGPNPTPRKPSDAIEWPPPTGH